MSKEGFKKLKDDFLKNKSQLLGVVYFVIKDDNEEIFVKKADIDEEAQTSLSKNFIKNLEEIYTTYEGLEAVIDLSADDDRKDVMYYYDLNTYPDKLKDVLNKLTHAAETNDVFEFGEQKLSGVQGFLIEFSYLGKTLILYKKYYPFNYYSRDYLWGIEQLGAKKRIVEMTSDVIKISPDCDFMIVDQELFILKLSVLEKSFGVQEIIQNKALDCIKKVQELDLVTNIEGLKESLEDISIARKLIKASVGSKVLTDSNMKVKVKKFIESNPYLSKRFKYTDDGNRLSLETKQAQRDFIKLLNDDFLFSQLTEDHYECRSKDKMNKVG